ncbi:MAG: PD-(D/E)XK nuclease family protein [Faecousia sp.]
MALLRLLLGQDWTANRDAVLGEIAGDVKRKKGNRILMVPELISHDTERRLAAMAGDTASRFAEVLSFTRLLRRVAELRGFAAVECMDNGGRVVAMASAARQTASRLKAYASVETKPEFLTGLVDAVDEFKRCCIGSGDLAAAARQTEGNLAQKLEELALLLETYDALCQRGKKDPRDQMTWLLEQLEDSDYAENHTFYIDGFPDFTRQHLAIIGHLIGHSPQVTVSLNCDKVGSKRAAFEKAGKTAAQILKLAEKAGIPVEIQVIPDRDNALKPVRQALFQGKAERIPDAGERLLPYRCDTVYEECTAAAERILELVRKGVRYREIGVVCTDPARYRPLLTMVFRKAGIPAYLSGNEPVLDKSAVATVISAMDAAVSGLDQKAVLRYLKSELSPLDSDTCDRLENYAVTWGIRGSRWEQEWVWNPDGLTDKWTDAHREMLERLNRAREAALAPILQIRRDLMNATDLGQQVMALYRFLDRIGLAERLDQMAAKMDAAGDRRGAQELNQLWEILLTALEQMYDVLGKTHWDTETFGRLFRLLLSQYEVGTIPPVLDAVTVGEVTGMRCQQVKHLIVLGAEEGMLPSYGGSSGVLTDQERVALRELGVPLTGGAMDALEEAFAEIYGVFCGADESIMVTCAAGQSASVYRRLCAMAGLADGVIFRENGTVPGANAAEAGAYLARFREEEQAETLGVGLEYEKICARADYSHGTIQPEGIRGLYGDKLTLSASQIDRQAECRFSYFLRYGLRAKERKENTVDPAEFGTYVHAVLEQTAREIRDLGGFHAVSLERTLEIAHGYAKKYADERFSQLDSSRVQYLFRRNNEELDAVVRELWEELSVAGFAPVDFEVYFGENGKMPPIPIHGAAMDAEVQGYVDRVDTWEDHGRNFFRVVDYKTGKKSFDYCDVFNGVGLQMLLYLFALEQGGRGVVGENPVPAGVQYFPARVPLIASDGRLTSEEADIQRDAERKRKGLILLDEQVIQAMEPGDSIRRLSCKRKSDGTLTGDLADAEQLRQLRAYVFDCLRSLTDQIASGQVEPNPYMRGTSHSACGFCPYGAVCRLDGTDACRNYKTMSAQRFWEEIEKEVRSHGGYADN